MNESKRKLFAAAFAALPDGCKYDVATEAQLEEFESTFCAIPDDFRWFLIHCAGGTIGSEWVDGIDELPNTHRKFKEESNIAHGWTMDGVFVIGWDVPAIRLVSRQQLVEFLLGITTSVEPTRCPRRLRPFLNVDFYRTNDATEPSHAREWRWHVDFEIKVNSRHPVMRVVS